MFSTPASPPSTWLAPSRCSSAPGVDPVFVALEPGPVLDDSGHCPLQATQGVTDVMAADVVVVLGSDAGLEPNASLLAWLQLVHPTTSWTASVGTGSLYLAAAGLLACGEAATHWASAEKLRRFSVRYSDQRVVRHGKIITAAGSSAGIDMALTLVGLTHGPAVRNFSSQVRHLLVRLFGLASGSAPSWVR